MEYHRQQAVLNLEQACKNRTEYGVWQVAELLTQSELKILRNKTLNELTQKLNLKIGI